MSQLFSEYRLRDLVLRNRAAKAGGSAAAIQLADARAVLDGNSSCDLWPKQAGTRIRDLDRLLKRGG